MFNLMKDGNGSSLSSSAPPSTPLTPKPVEIGQGSGSWVLGEGFRVQDHTLAWGDKVSGLGFGVQSEDSDFRFQSQDSGFRIQRQDIPLAAVASRALTLSIPPTTPHTIKGLGLKNHKS